MKRDTRVGMSETEGSPSCCALDLGTVIRYETTNNVA